MKVWLSNVLQKLSMVIDRIINLLTNRLLDLVDVLINMLQKQLATFQGTITAFIVIIVIFEFLGIKVIGLTFNTLRDLITIIQPIIWPIIILIIIYLLMSERVKK